MKRIERFRAYLLVAILALTVVPGTATAETAANEAGIGVVSALASLIYGPTKIVYASLGLVFGGLAWGLSGGDSDVLSAVVTPAVRGDYVITPSHMRGERQIEFMGQNPDYRASQVATMDDEPLVEDDY